MIEAPAASGGFFVYLREVKHANCEYEPFGSLLPGRNYSSNTYRHGFNGMEKDNEVFGADGTAYTTFFRGYDSRTAQWWSVDPDAKKLPQWSAYQAMNRNPISLVDPMGNSAGKTYDKDSGKLIHDDGIDDKKVYLGTKTDGSDREDGAGNLNMPFAYESQIQDVTGKFDKVLDGASQKWLDRRVDIEETSDFTFGLGRAFAKNIEFGASFAPGGVDDLKNHDTPGNAFAQPEKVGTSRGVYHKGYAFYNGELKRFDDFGNMKYGAAGRAAGFSEGYLQNAAGAAQFMDYILGGTPAIGPSGGDEVRDRVNINAGFTLGGSWMGGGLVHP